MTANNHITTTPRTGALSDPARRVLAHIRGRTTSGKFACQLWDMPDSIWHSALDELTRAGYQITWTYGQVQDEPAVTGGYVLRDPASPHLATATAQGAS